MRIKDNQDNDITTFDEWARLYETGQKSRQWKEHRSAYSVAEFILNRDGTGQLESRVSSVVGEPVSFERAIPEHEVRFDQYGKGRIHDLGIYGATSSGKSVFVGLEAKVDETFGATVHDEYLKAKSNQIAGESTNAPERIEKLLALHFSAPDPSMFDVRYQLLYATVGTISAKADISVLYVIVFKTPLYSEMIGADNYRDYVHFMNMVGGKSLSLEDKGAIAHELELGGKRLFCLHEYFQL